jgi:SAM-dependent methyltransferase
MTTKGAPMPMQEVIAAVVRLQASVEALAALGARAALSEGDGTAPEVVAALDDVLAAAGVGGLDDLAPPQKMMMVGAIRSIFGQANDLLMAANRAPGWQYTDPVVLDGIGRGSGMIPGLLAQTPEGKDVSSFLDVGVGIGALAIAATQVWPASTVVGLDIWEPALERARQNVAGAGVEDRIELRRQDVTELDDVDRFDLAWVPSFFFTEDALRIALQRVTAAVRSGGCVVVGRYNVPPDPVAGATLRLRTLRDGGAHFDDEVIGGLLTTAGCTDVHPLALPGPLPLAFIAGRKA